MSCEHVRSQMWEARSGGLSPSEKSAYEEHLLSCVACREVVGRLTDMFEAQKSVEHGEMPALDKDGIFGKIAQRIALPTQIVATEPVPDIPMDDEFESNPGSSRSVWVWVAAAAAVILGLGVIAYTQMGVSSGPHVEIAVTPPATSPDPDESEEPRSAPELEMAQWTHHVDRAHEVNLFAAPDSDWRISGKNDLLLELRQGGLLVEFFAGSNRSLQLYTEYFELIVVGTIFYASVESDGRGLIGVVEGEVEVTMYGRDPMRLVSGQEYELGQGLREISPMHKDQVKEVIDVDTHRQKLRQPVQTAKSRSPVQQADATDRRALARQAMRRGDYARGALLLEQALIELPTDHPIALSIRLDLARVYSTNLDRPEQALRHLRAFVTASPQDPAAPMARTELCRLVASLGVEDPLCR